jgi:hypothetical protein
MQYFEPASESSDADEGEQVWIYVQNVSGGTLAAGRGVARDLATTDNYEVVATPAGVHPARLAGVVPGNLDSAFVDDSFAWVKRTGSIEVDVTTGGTAGVGVMISATVAGEFDDVAAITGASAGIFLATLGAPGLVKAHIDCRG